MKILSVFIVVLVPTVKQEEEKVRKLDVLKLFYFRQQYLKACS